MANKAIATSWTVDTKDETGAFVSLHYTCPHCHYANSELILIGASNIDKIDNGFETDHVCGICGKDVIIECR